MSAPGTAGSGAAGGAPGGGAPGGGAALPDLERWPGVDKRRVSRTSSGWAVRAPLLRWLQEEGEAAARAHGRTLRVLDVGCGNKPYYPYFAACAAEYVGVDVVPGPQVDLVGGVEALPVPDGSFDLVVCTQVLEHVDDPLRAVAELRRVTAPGGRVLASTHGVQAYHPSPGDYWRWTRAGLEKLFRESAAWASVTVVPGSGSAACVAMLISFYIRSTLRRLRLDPLGAGLAWTLNTLAGAVDRASPSFGGTGPGTLHANYHVMAVAPGARAKGLPPAGPGAAGAAGPDATEPGAGEPAASGAAGESGAAGAAGAEAAS